MAALAVPIAIGTFANGFDKMDLQKLISAKGCENCNLSGADLYETELSGAILLGANLSDANLSGANLSFAKLAGANLRHVDLSGADLSFTDLRQAQLEKATLCGTKMPWGEDNSGCAE